jgi:hypothetical protein
MTGDLGRGTASRHQIEKLYMAEEISVVAIVINPERASITQ